ncbi:MAG TPA: hypothetical protein VK765_02325 [Solirubrobacteraceae bacterium]|jgi:hypothetical protein|nr:hypothetical protein [Solirubrobacteraceae bacterium]
MTDEHAPPATVPAAAAATSMPHPFKTRRHLAKAVRFSPSEIKQAMSEVEGFNAKLAVLITHAVGSMAMAYIFCLIALTSLPAILIEAGVLTSGDVPKFLTKPGLILIVAWIAQTFIQLVLLSIIMVGQDVQSIASDARSENTFKDTQAILDAMNCETEGGLRTILDAIEAQTKLLQQKSSGSVAT